MTLKNRSKSQKPKTTSHQPKTTVQKPQTTRLSEKNPAQKSLNPASELSGRTDTLDGKSSGASNPLLSDLNKAIADITAAIAELSSEGIGNREKGIGNRDGEETLSPIPYTLSPLEKSPDPSSSKIGPNPLPAPTLVIMSVSSNSILVDWDKVTNANGYIIEVANDSLFTDPVSLNIDATATSWNIDGLNANTTYYIRVMATGTGVNGNSGFSNVQSIKTLNDVPGGMDGGIVGDLQNWLEQEQTLFQNMTALVPQLETTELNSAARMRLRGSGVRRYGFIEKVFEVSADYPQFWPPFGAGKEDLSEYLKEIDALRNLLIWFRYAARAVQDLLLIAGDDAFRAAGAYYTLARDGAKRRNPEAVQVFDMLRLFWKRPRRSLAEPTEHEVERDVRALLRGTKDGQVSVSNESDSVVKGKKVIIDNTVKKPRGGVKVVESAEVE